MSIHVLFLQLHFPDVEGHDAVFCPCGVCGLFKAGGLEQSRRGYAVKGQFVAIPCAVSSGVHQEHIFFGVDEGASAVAFIIVCHRDNFSSAGEHFADLLAAFDIGEKVYPFAIFGKPWAIGEDIGIEGARRGVAIGGDGPESEFGTVAISIGNEYNCRAVGAKTRPLVLMGSGGYLFDLFAVRIHSKDIHNSVFWRGESGDIFDGSGVSA